VYYVYILQLKNLSYYHGYSGNLRQKLSEHTAGEVSSTKNLLPLKLVYYSAFETKSKAIEFEKYLKSSLVLPLEIKD